MTRTARTALTITPKQLEVLRFVFAHRRERGFSPTLDEIGIYLGVHKSTARDHVVGLITAGALACTEWGTPRAIFVTELAESHLSTLAQEPA